MSTSHTPGRLGPSSAYQDSERSGFWSVDVRTVRPDGENHVATVHGLHSTPEAREAAEANAQRLSACWNACDGVRTEALESGDVNILLKSSVHAMEFLKLGNTRGALACLKDAFDEIYAISKAEGSLSPR